MSGVPIGILLVILLIIIPPVMILRAKYASLKERVIWFLISLLGLFIGFFLGYLQALDIQNAQTDTEKIELLVSQSIIPNMIMNYWALITFLIFRYLYFSKRKSKILKANKSNRP